ncbi:MAG: ATP-binding protein [Bacteroidales bacterium]|nr:ATP-binding protein [Candidatus Cacconaster caballi]
MNASIIEKVLLEQQDELEGMRGDVLIHRPEEDRINLQSKLAQVVIGVRRSGKSTLCFNALEKAGVNYAYANFDDDRLEGLTADDLDKILELLYKIYGKFDYLFLDEIQNVEGWHLFVNRLLRQKLHIVVTGSNSRLLSGELASHLTGRHHKIELFPFSFADWCRYKSVETEHLTTRNRGLLQGEFARYMKQGGFPELLYETDQKDYINTLFDNIISQDIKKRFKVRNVDAIKKMAINLLDTAPTFIVKENLQKNFAVKSDHTVNKYLSYLTQTYLVSTLSKYSTKSKERIRNEKAYAIDVAFMDKRQDAFSGPNMGFRLETIVYLELRRRCSRQGLDLYYYNNGTSEADFVVCDGNKTQAVYQVTFSLENEKTRRREIRGAVAGTKGTNSEKTYIITDHDDEETLVVNGYTIYVVPVWKWLIAE